MINKKQEKSKTRNGQTKRFVPPSNDKEILNNVLKSTMSKAKILAISSKGFILRHSIIANIISSFAIIIPPYLISQYYQIDKFAAEIKSLFPPISTLLDHHVIIGVLLGGGWTFIVLAIYQALVNFVQDQPNGWAKAPSILLQTLDNIVGAKEQRFSQYLKSIKDSNCSTSSASAFSNITQPSLQLNEIIRGIYSTLDSLLRDQEISKYVLKVNLAAIDQNQDVKRIYFHYPNDHPVRSSISALNNPNSAIKNAIKTKRIIVLESIHAESAQTKASFVITDPTRAGEDGSLICYPISYDPMNAVVFVISIHVDQPGIFKSQFNKTYVELLKPFSLRIKLEYALLALKELTDNEQTN